MELKYESTDAAIAGTAQYNGNISQQIWASSTTVRHAYGYTYDQINQLSIAEYEKYNGSWNQDAGRFNEQATYDLNGNIQSLIRGGATAWSSGQPSGYGTMDNLTYKYKGNQLMSVGDAIPVISGNNKYDMADNGSNLVYDVANPVATAEYSYDVNGNMTQDKNKGITSIEYNYLNLPTKVEFGADHQNRIEWIYTVSGAKLRKTVYKNGTIDLTQDYVSGFVYKNGTLDYSFTDVGRIKRKSNGSVRYEYTLSDHLGNARVMFIDDDNNGVAEVEDESHFYAFGLRIEGLGTPTIDNKVIYNGKEIEEYLGLNWYHFGARYYDPQLGRWHSIDPLGQYLSPYQYVGNDPMNFMDHDGTWGDPSDGGGFWDTFVDAIGTFFSGGMDEQKDKTEAKMTSQVGKLQQNVNEALTTTAIVGAATTQVVRAVDEKVQQSGDMSLYVGTASLILALPTGGATLPLAGLAGAYSLAADATSTLIEQTDAVLLGGSENKANLQLVKTATGAGAAIRFGFAADKIVRGTGFATGPQYRAASNTLGLVNGRFVSNSFGTGVIATKEGLGAAIDWGWKILK
ncbi:RHS repeat-associated core domain-containing protein [bacterium]|nr:RHS repeat-associated core domain-containing protein [bacterium]NUN46650.1 RHS repeat-associated core domain-containing protein [bacterium]